MHKIAFSTESFLNNPNNLGGNISVRAKSVEQAIFNYVAEFAGLLFIDIGDIQFYWEEQPEKNQTMFSCRICNLQFSQLCSNRDLLREDPAVLGMAFFRSMLEHMSRFCVKKAITARLNEVNIEL